MALLSLINPGDEVILSQPFYENYWPDCVLAGAMPRFVPVRPPHWKFDPDELAAAFNDRTKAIVLCNPNNPTGAVFTREDLEEIAALCRKWDVIAITDEIYEHILYDGRPHVALAGLDGMRERSVTISGMSKTYAVTGWRIGTIIAPPHLTRPSARCTTSSRSARRPRSSKPARSPTGCRASITLSSPPTTRPGAIASARRSGTSASSSSPRGGLLHHGRHRRLRRRRRCRLRPPPRPRRGRGHRPRLQLLPGQGAGRPYVRFCFCKRDETLDAAAERLQGAEGHRLRGLGGT